LRLETHPDAGSYEAAGFRRMIFNRRYGITTNHFNAFIVTGNFP
jgi:hypothetical protein